MAVPVVLSPANAFPGGAFPQHLSGKSTVRSYTYPGAVQPLATLPTTVLSPSNAFPAIPLPNHKSGQSNPKNQIFPGAIQPGLLVGILAVAATKTGSRATTPSLPAHVVAATKAAVKALSSTVGKVPVLGKSPAALHITALTSGAAALLGQSIDASRARATTPTLVANLLTATKAAVKALSSTAGKVGLLGKTSIAGHGALYYGAFTIVQLLGVSRSALKIAASYSGRVGIFGASADASRARATTPKLVVPLLAATAATAKAMSRTAGKVGILARSPAAVMGILWDHGKVYITGSAMLKLTLRALTSGIVPLSGSTAAKSAGWTNYFTSFLSALGVLASKAVPALFAFYSGANAAKEIILRPPERNVLTITPVVTSMTVPYDPTLAPAPGTMETAKEPVAITVPSDSTTITVPAKPTIRSV